MKTQVTRVHLGRDLCGAMGNPRGLRRSRHAPRSDDGPIRSPPHRLVPASAARARHLRTFGAQPRAEVCRDNTRSTALERIFGCSLCACKSRPANARST